MLLKDVVIANLNTLMKERGDCSSQNALAKKSRVSQSHVGRILRGESTPTLEMIEALSGALRVPPSLLLMENLGRTAPAEDAPIISARTQSLIDLIAKLDTSAENRSVLEAAEVLLSKALPKQEEAARGNLELKALLDQYLKTPPESASPESIAWLRKKMEDAASNQSKNNNGEKKKQAGGSGA